MYKINFRFGLPLFFLFIHQHASNSVIGINNSVVGLTLFFLLIFSMCFFLITNNKLGYSKLLMIFSLLIFIGLWLTDPVKFKDISNFFINCFITYYIICQGGFLVTKNQLTILVVASALLGLVQLWGITPLVHEWNSQFLDEKAGQIIRNIEVNNIMNSEYKYSDWYDSRQVRAPGIFHSSALVSGIFVMYISFVFLGYYKALKNYVFVPFLCIFSGAKLVLLATILFLILSIVFRKISFKQFSILFLSSLFAILISNFLFPSLLRFQFNTDILFYSFDVRIRQYNWDILNLTVYFPYFFLIFSVVFFLFLFNKIFKISSSNGKAFYFLVLFIAVSASFFSTPQIGNLLFGWFYFPAFFCFKYWNNIEMKDKIKC